MEVVIYSKNGCEPCEHVKNLLNEQGISYTEKNITGNKTNLHELKDKGYSSVPIIEAEGLEPINGFDYPKIEQLIEKYKAQ